jgi:glycerophosphoryl diester phosphodiesterase
LTEFAPSATIRAVKRPFIIQGHRGARGLRPENTLPGFEAALASGANSLETDVHVTADGVPVLIHDKVLPGGTRAIQTTLYREVAAADVPALRDLLRLVAGRDVLVDLDIKWQPFRNASTTEATASAILDVVRREQAEDQTWVRSFDHRMVRHLRGLEPRLTGVVLIEGTCPVDPVALVRAADAQVYAPDYLFLNEEQTRQCHAAGIRVLPWTVNDPADWQRLIAWDVDGITTDYPDRLAALVPPG